MAQLTKIAVVANWEQGENFYNAVCFGKHKKSESSQGLKDIDKFLASVSLRAIFYF